jgi:hypothetical protein
LNQTTHHAKYFAQIKQYKDPGDRVEQGQYCASEHAKRSDGEHAQDEDGNLSCKPATQIY